jgi:UDP-N-acetylglucosamine 2-epimerase (non-hydrolysing)/GDP/UDP-N,N'-diacetylbacillosamine 2-epimerase (hydrolysing)
MIKIVCLTGTRADYPRVKSVLLKLNKNKKFKLKLVVTGTHLSKKYGYSVKEIIKDKLHISRKIPIIRKNHNRFIDVSLSASQLVKEFSKYLSYVKPDLVLLTVDRYETLASAMSAFLMNIPIAHIQGGEVTGTADETIRHAVTKLSNFHFVANSDAKKRLIKLGEYKKNIFNFGCPYIDVIKKIKYSPKKILFNKLNLDLNKKTVIFIQHSVTSEIHAVKKQIQITIDSLNEFKNIQIVSIFSNSDAGGKFIIDKLKKSYQFNVLPNINSEDFLSLMRHADAMIGNSSAAIREAPSFSLPAVNIGTRQNKRLRAKNIIDCEHSKDSIVKALNKALYNKKFLNNLKNLKNPYGDGNAAQKIVDKLLNLNLKNFNIQKTITY